MVDDSKRWDTKYEARPDRVGDPDTFLVRHLAELLPGRVLDLASGDGRNSLFLAESGFQVCAVDISKAALERLSRFARHKCLDVETHLMDLESDALAPLDRLGRFESIIVFNYKLNAALWQKIPALLYPKGIFVYCTFNLEHHRLNGFPLKFCIHRDEYDVKSAGFETVCFETLDEADSRRYGGIYRLV